MKTQPLTFIRPVARTIASQADRLQAVQPTWTRLEVILKVTERCNINCTYCYFFNSENVDFKSHPPYVGASTIDECGRFLAQAAQAGKVTQLQIDLHGGEPLMMKKERFDAMCTALYAALSEVPSVEIVMQTNAMLIDKEWIALFAKHRIAIGISIDGPKEYHDRYRIDHQERGTYERTIDGLKLLQAAIADRTLTDTGVGMICVIDPDQDARVVFSHFVDTLGLKSLHFLLPMHDHDTVPEGINVRLAPYLCDLFDAWVERGDPQITIRYFHRLLWQLMDGAGSLGSAHEVQDQNIAFTIASNGDIGPADDLRNTFQALFWTGANVASATLTDFLQTDAMAAHRAAVKARHPSCKSCCWGRICDGGDAIGTEAFRYSRRNGFANPSIYCESIKALLTHMSAFALQRGVSFEHIAQALIKDETAGEESGVAAYV